MNAESSPSWYRCHPLTWTAVLFVAAAIYYRQPDDMPIFANNLIASPAYWDHSGWPLWHIELIYMRDVGPSSTEQVTYRSLFAHRLALNVCAWLALLASSVFVCESFLRAGWAWRFSLRDIFLAMVAVAIVLVCFSEHMYEFRLGMAVFEPAWEVGGHFGPWRSSLLRIADLVNPLGWPLVFSIAATAYTGAWLAWEFLAWCFPRRNVEREIST